MTEGYLFTFHFDGKDIMFDLKPESVDQNPSAVILRKFIKGVYLFCKGPLSFI